MSEMFDQAQELEMLQRDAALAHTRAHAPVIAAKGNCLFCDEPLGALQRWCDAECCRSWEREQEASRRNGKPIYEDPMDDFSASM